MSELTPEDRQELSRQISDKASRAFIYGKTRNEETASKALGVSLEAIDKVFYIEALPDMNAESISTLLGITSKKLLEVLHSENVSFKHGVSGAFMELIGL